MPSYVRRLACLAVLLIAMLAPVWALESCESIKQMCSTQESSKCKDNCDKALKDCERSLSKFDDYTERVEKVTTCQSECLARLQSEQKSQDCDCYHKLTKHVPSGISNFCTETTMKFEGNQTLTLEVKWPVITFCEDAADKAREQYDESLRAAGGVGESEACEVPGWAIAVAVIIGIVGVAAMGLMVRQCKKNAI
ncbi:MAG: hypothetical protein MHM6MM_001338 [Cercozoa sp. M6MM]